MITIKPKAKYRFHAPTMLLLYIVFYEYNKILKRSCTFFKIYYHTSFHGPALSGAIYTSTSQVPVSAILLLQVTGNQEI
jgi:hypothetical protein